MEHFGDFGKLLASGKEGRGGCLHLTISCISYANILPGGALEVLADIASKVLSHAVSA